MQGAVWQHRLIPTALGSRNMSLAAKFHALLHSLRMEADSCSLVGTLAANTVAITTDYGVEAGLTAMGFDTNDPFPHWDERQCNRIVDDVCFSVT
eukprot:1065613-Amphidinium_carterae.1